MGSPTLFDGRDPPPKGARANDHDRSFSAELCQAIAAWLERFEELDEAA